jgi:hypothetical protein
MARPSRSALLLLGVALLACTALPRFAYAEDADESDVVVITASNFEEKVKGAKYALVRIGRRRRPRPARRPRPRGPRRGAARRMGRHDDRRG